jgi:hypothetical protein
MNYVLSKTKDPKPLLTVEVVGSDDAHLTQMFSRNIGDRITLEADGSRTQLGIDQDFYIENITFQFDRSRLPRCVWQLSPAAANPNYWILNLSDDLGTDTILAY